MTLTTAECAEIAKELLAFMTARLTAKGGGFPDGLCVVSMLNVATITSHTLTTNARLAVKPK